MEFIRKYYGVVVILFSFIFHFLLHVSVLAQSQTVKDVTIDGYTFKYFYEPYQNSVDGSLYNKEGQQIVTLNNFLLQNLYQAVILKDELIWISGPKIVDNSEERKVELRITNLKTKETKTILSAQSINFLVNHKANLIAISHNAYDKKVNKGSSTVTLIDREHNQRKEILTKTESYTIGFYDLVGWSTDDSMLWITSGLEDFWDQLILYRNGEIQKFHGIHGSDDTIFDCDRGWVTYSDYPVIHVSDEREDFEKSGKTTTLWLYDVLNQKRAKVASGKANSFRPKWDRTLPNKPRLIYFIGEKKHQVDPIQLLISTAHH